MREIQTITIKEFDSLTRNIIVSNEAYHPLSENMFDRLEQYLLNNKFDTSELLSISNRRGIGKIISAKNYVGIISVKNQLVIEILPKIYNPSKHSSITETRRVFTQMITYLPELPFKQLLLSNLDCSINNLLDLFIEMFLHQVSQLMKQGLLTSYSMVISNESFLKGKLLVGEQIKHNSIHKERFMQEYQLLNIDCPENRLIKSTLVLLEKLPIKDKTQQLLRKIRLVFNPISCSQNIDGDFSRITYNQRTKYYNPIMKWCKLFLKHYSFTSLLGNECAYALLFPMELVYERYIACKLRSFVDPALFQYKIQDKTHYLFDKPISFNLQPDIVIISKSYTIILDTKWKLLNSTKRNFGIASSDMYQMYTYANIYEAKNIILLYPWNSNMGQYIYKSFQTKHNITIELFLLNLVDIEESLKIVANHIKKKEENW